MQDSVWVISLARAVMLHDPIKAISFPQCGCKMNTPDLLCFFGNIRIPLRPPPPTTADFPSDSGWENLGTPQTGRLLKGAFGPSQNFIRHSLGACHTQGVRHRHLPVDLSRHLPPSQCLILPWGADLDSLFTPSLLPQSGTSLALQHRWQTRVCKLQHAMMLSMRMRVIHQHCDCQWCYICLNFGRKHWL